MKGLLKKGAALLMAAALTMGFAACQTDEPAPPAAPQAPAETVTLRVWASQDDQDITKSLVDAFIAANPDKQYDIQLGVVGEPDAAARYLEDPTAAADVFAFPNDQLYTLTNAGALYEVTLNKDAIIAANVAGAIESASVGDALYAYPMTADNGYFLYYDKSVISEEQVQTLDGILEACNAAGKQFLMDISNGWYVASFFLGAGGSLELTEDGAQLCDFNNETGVKVGEAIFALCGDEAYLDGDDAVLQGGMGDTIAAGVSGTWNAASMEEKLGENYAATKLPTFTLDGEQVQMSSFGGYKLIGVNSQTKFPLDAMALAEWLTNEESQLTRYEVRQLGPSNINAASSDAVLANLPLAALSLQSQFASSQTNVLGGYWTPAEAFGQAMVNQDTSQTIPEFLDMMVEQITLQ
ncbi:MAG: extracellular solute-binding protein [Clostridiales bacterium]|jgi:arabinogalactan oligomer/maltooligosaccharide transport system substrate-binding protein|nr:extracellular solute-binding protein [Clostridiales bacterium]